RGHGPNRAWRQEGSERGRCSGRGPSWRGGRGWVRFVIFGESSDGAEPPFWHRRWGLPPHSGGLWLGCRARRRVETGRAIVPEKIFGPTFPRIVKEPGRLTAVLCCDARPASR